MYRSVDRKATQKISIFEIMID